MWMVRWWHGFWSWVFVSMACSISHDWYRPPILKGKVRECLRCHRVEVKTKKPNGTASKWSKE